MRRSPALRIVVSLGALAIVSGVLVADSFGNLARAAIHDNNSGISWQYSETANGYWREPQSRETDGGSDGPATVYVEYGKPGERLKCPEKDKDFACQDEESGEYISVKCGAETGPNGLPVYPWMRYERKIEDGEPGLWVGKDVGCDEPQDDDFVSMQEISNHIDYRVFQPLGKPKVDVEPAGRTLVNLPTIVSTNYPEGVGPPAELLSLEDARVRIPIDIEVPGDNLTGEIIAEANFEWQFENGETATGRGRPYEEGVSPQDHPGYYTTGTFTSTGEKTINLTATWTGEVTVETLAPEQIEPVVREQTVTMDVVESRSRLSDGG